MFVLCLWIVVNNYMKAGYVQDSTRLFTGPYCFYEIPMGCVLSLMSTCWHAYDPVFIHNANCFVSVLSSTQHFAITIRFFSVTAW